MRPRLLVVLALLAVGGTAIGQRYLSGIVWPEPPVVTPGEGTAPPSDAIVLFGGKDLSQWKNGDVWKVEDGVATVHATDIETKASFGDYQLHVEWAAPAEVNGNGQGRGNSGVFLSGRYEVQVLDSFQNETYFDGQAASIYKQRPPLVNACRKPGEWQTYDIIYEAPRFNDDKTLQTPGYVTVLHNGVLVQNHLAIEGNTSWDRPPAYDAHPLKQPIRLQNHGNPVRYRNLWLRELPDPSEALDPAKP